MSEARIPSQQPDTEDLSSPEVLLDEGRGRFAEFVDTVRESEFYQEAFDKDAHKRAQKT